MSRAARKAQSDSFETWCAPNLGDATSGSKEAVKRASHSPGLMTRKQADSAQRKAYEEGFELGYKEGRAAGEQNLAAQASRLEQLMSTLAQPFKDLDKEVEQALIALSASVARQILRCEIKTEPDQIMVIIREAISVLQGNSRAIELRLHPVDADYVRKLIATPDSESPWQIREDPAVTQGGCLVVTDTAQVDATIESRIDAAISAISGGKAQ